MQDKAQAGSPLAASELENTPQPGDSQRSPASTALPSPPVLSL